MTTIRAEQLGREHLGRTVVFHREGDMALGGVLLRVTHDSEWVAVVIQPPPGREATWVLELQDEVSIR